MNDSALHSLESIWSSGNHNSGNDDDDNDNGGNNNNNNNNYNYDNSIAIIDGKCNQLQDDLFSLETKVNELKKIFDFKLNEYKETLTTILKTYHHHQQRCSVLVHSNFICIHNYQPSSLRFLIGVQGETIKRIEDLYNIRVKIPKRFKQPNSPIRIFPRKTNNYNDNGIMLLNGISCMVDILNNNY